ncbi:unnamed protein product [Peniophora sp. CBMAI 1063]|nr:unnamed protein product [Peniophora sp. CBMAI 1063]
MDYVQWSWDEHLKLAQETFPGHWPSDGVGCIPELGKDAQGSFNALERVGLNSDIKKNDVLLFFDIDSGEPPMPGHQALFRYSEKIREGTVPDLHGPDDPSALAPRDGVEICALLVKQVVSYCLPGTEGATCTWALGQRFSLGWRIPPRYPLRCMRIIKPYLDYLHPREHVLTDLWQAVRLHNVVAVAQLRTLRDRNPVIPPPVGTPEAPVLYWSPGCLYGLNPVPEGAIKPALEFRQESTIRVATCSFFGKGCRRKVYNPAEDRMVCCVSCKRWYHEDCSLRPLNDEEYRGETVHWRDVRIAGPATRRCPNDAAPVWQAALCGLDMRVDPPVHSWERISFGLREAGRLAKEGAIYDAAEFHAEWRAAAQVKQDSPFMARLSDSEVDEAMLVVERHGPEMAAGLRRFICNYCTEFM